MHPVENCWEDARDFEKIACGEHHITNEDIIGREKMIDNQDGKIIDDYIYLDLV